MVARESPKCSPTRGTARFRVNTPLFCRARKIRSRSSRTVMFSREPVLASSAEITVCTCACRKLNPGILVMQSAQDWATKNVPGAIDGARDRCILLQGEMRAGLIVQQRLRTPTGPFFARFFIGIILGLVAEFAFMRPSRRLRMSFSAHA